MIRPRRLAALCQFVSTACWAAFGSPAAIARAIASCSLTGSGYHIEEDTDVEPSSTLALRLDSWCSVRTRVRPRLPRTPVKRQIQIEVVALRPARGCHRRRQLDRGTQLDNECAAPGAAARPPYELRVPRNVRRSRTTPLRCRASAVSDSQTSPLAPDRVLRQTLLARVGGNALRTGVRLNPSRSATARSEMSDPGGRCPQIMAARRSR